MSPWNEARLSRVAPANQHVPQRDAPRPAYWPRLRKREALGISRRLPPHADAVACTGPEPSRVSAANERTRTAPTVAITVRQRAEVGARERVGESEGRSPSDEVGGVSGTSFATTSSVRRESGAADC